MLLDLPVKSECNKKLLEEKIFDPEELTNQSLVVMSSFRSAMQGEPDAIKIVVNKSGMSEAEREQFKLKRSMFLMEKKT